MDIIMKYFNFKISNTTIMYYSSFSIILHFIIIKTLVFYLVDQSIPQLGPDQR